MRVLLALFIFIANLAGLRLQQAADDPLEFKDMAVFYKYGDQATFQATLTSTVQNPEVYLFLQTEGEPTRTEKVTSNENGEIIFNYDLRQKPLRPFARIEYWFRAVLPGNVLVPSAHQAFQYEDNRFTWQQLDEGQFQVRWIQGDLAFGQAILNAAKAGVRSATSFLPNPLTSPLRIYVYSRASDLQSALQLSQKPWMAGHASPDLGVILVSIPPGPEQELELERQIPHEIMHVITYQAVGAGYDHLPAWYIEGLASLAELNPNPDYQIALDRARQTNTLMSFNSLCTAFPVEASGAFLAYAQSASFVRFLLQKYGSPGIQKLSTVYQSGVGCEEGASTAFGSSLEQLEVRWQQEVLGMDMGAFILANLAPYLAALALLVVIPLALGLLILIQKKPHPEKAT